MPTDWALYFLTGIMMEQKEETISIRRALANQVNTLGGSGNIEEMLEGGFYDLKDQFA